MTVAVLFWRVAVCAASSLAVCSTTLWIVAFAFPIPSASVPEPATDFLYVRSARACQVQQYRLVGKYNYIGLKYLLKKRNIMDFDLLFQEFPEHILPYDYEAYFHCPERYVMVTTNCETGEANYFEEKRSKERVIDIVRASSSLPFVCPVTYVDNTPMLDGGIVDSIPLMRARQDGFTNNVVVLTRNHGYRKEIQGTKVPPFIYKKYPLLREAINRRSIVYNQQLEQVERMEAAGEIIVIRPQKPVVVDRIERDIKKLTELYEEGYRCAEQFVFRF